jgi:hypothetical protein
LLKKNGKLNMKNLSMKKIALGLFLAGYAASSAYALGPVSTVNTIQGSKPVIFSKDSNAEGQLTVRISADTTGRTASANGVAKVGDYIHIFYMLKDADGDLDTSERVKGTLKVWKQMPNDTTWTEVADITKVADNSGEDGHIYFEITPSMVGAAKIGFQLQEATTYGNPATNRWLQVPDIWGAGNPTKTPNEEQDPGQNPGGPGNPDPGNPIGPIAPPSNAQFGIFKYTGSSLDIAAGNYATSSTAIPKYGDQLAAVVWVGAPSAPATGDTILSSGMNFTWSLVGQADGISAVTTEEITVGISRDNDGNSVIALGNVGGSNHNSLYSGLNGGQGYNAGIQGFNLQVKTN